MTKTTFLKILKYVEEERVFHRFSSDRIKIKVLFADGSWEIDCRKYNLIKVRKVYRSMLHQKILKR